MRMTGTRVAEPHHIPGKTGVMFASNFLCDRFPTGVYQTLTVDITRLFGEGTPKQACVPDTPSGNGILRGGNSLGATTQGVIRTERY